MKKYVRSSKDNYFDSKKLAEDAADTLWVFQESLAGDPRLSDMLSNEDIEILDKAHSILAGYASEV